MMMTWETALIWSHAIRITYIRLVDILIVGLNKCTDGRNVLMFRNNDGKYERNNAHDKQTIIVCCEKVTQIHSRI